MVGLLIATSLWYPKDAPLARYDFLFIAAVAIQITMLAYRLETFAEAKVILVFHIVGTAMEVFKTAAGSWIYPEAAFFRIGGVPLFSGFMYAAIGSDIARSWRLFDFRSRSSPAAMDAVWRCRPAFMPIATPTTSLSTFAAVLFALLAVLCGRKTWIYYRIHYRYRRMPLLLGLLLVAMFIWIAENFGMVTRTWIYPNQLHGWAMVPLGKLGSWFLLMTISYTMVAWVNKPQPYRGR